MEPMCPCGLSITARPCCLAEQHSDNARYVRNILFGATENQGNLADFNVPTANGITTNANVLNMYRQNYPDHCPYQSGSSLD